MDSVYQRVDRRLSVCLVILSIAACEAQNLQNHQDDSIGIQAVKLGKLSLSNETASDFASSFVTTNDGGQRMRTSRLSVITTRRNQVDSTKKLNSVTRKQEEELSIDCVAKRNEVLSRQNHHSTTASATRSSTNLPSNFQRLKPKVDNGGNIGTGIVFNETLVNNLDGEHLPRCRHDGSYDPVQCHKIGYCWCVNKFGQAIKNSAVMSGEEPFCDPAYYNSDNNDLLVVAGISAQRMKNFLKTGGSPVESTTPNGHINFESSEIYSDSMDSDLHQQVDSAKRTGSVEPTMPLIPNDCRSSRANARERAQRYINDSIWVPDCDSSNEKLYAERQCHKSKVCWCVDLSSGLPLRTGEQLLARSANSNCTEIKRIIELTASISKPNPISEPVQIAFYQSSSEFCDADKRIEFVITLNSQFKQQISDYMRQNPTSTAPSDLSSTNPFTISDAQVAKWKFSIMDKDLDGKLGDREWSKFKNNFKLVDKADELENPFKLQKSPYFSLTPLLIVRSQRKCWRDFLEFCGSGDLLVDESISLSKWLSCTEVPPKSTQDENRARSQVSSLENTYAHSREAAIVRSKKKNPFLGILKPD